MLDVLKQCGACSESKQLSMFRITKGYHLNKCRECENEQARMAYHKDPAKFNARTIDWQQRNIERVQAKSKEWRTANVVRKRTTDKAWEAANPEKVKVKMMKSELKKFGLTIEEYDRILVSQNYACAVCKRPAEELRQRLCIDHDHNCCGSGRSCGECVRGLLCPSCNKGLGFLRDDLMILQEAVKYLSNSQLKRGN